MTEVFSAALINIKEMCDCVLLKFSSKIAWYYWRVHAYCCTLFYLVTCMNISQH